MVRRSRSRIWKRIGLVVLFLIVISSAFWLPLAIIKSTSSLDTLNAMESALIVTMKIATALFFLAVGSSIGSFVNVLAYRMPIGKSVVFKPSACPRCNSKIKLWHNIPIFGWLMLGGRCYVCKLPISMRYPLVELWFGSFFVVLFYVELATGTLNIPETRDYFVRTISTVVWGLDKETFGLYSFHCFLMCTLSTWTLFKVDRNRIPVMAILFPMVVGVIATLVWDFLHPVSWFLGSGLESLENGIGLAMMNIVCGAGGGWLLGFLIERICMRTGVMPFPFKGLIWGMAIVGLFLGWQALCSAVAIFGCIYFFARMFAVWWAWKPIPLLSIWTLAVLMQICLWRTLSQLSFWPGLTSHELSMVGVNVVVSGGTAIILIVLTDLWMPLGDAPLSREENTVEV